jgi:hypothetical protein
MPTVVHDRVKPLTVSIAQAAEVSGTSEWWIKQQLRARELEAVKANRRTLIIFASLERRMARLPKAEFAPPTELVAKRAAAVASAAKARESIRPRGRPAAA